MEIAPSLNMFPCLSGDYGVHIGGVNSIFFSKCGRAKLSGIWNIFFPAQTNDFFVNFCVLVETSGKVISSAFFYAIIDIIKCCSAKQMVRVATRRIIAFVKNIETFLDFSIFKLVSNSMSAAKLTSARFGGPFFPKKSVSEFMDRFSNPVPTFIFFRNLNIFPKVFFPIFCIIPNFFKAKMAWVDAGFNFTSPNNGHSFRDFSKMQNPRKAVTLFKFSANVNALVCRPNLARFCFVDSVKKPIRYAFHIQSVIFLTI